MSSSRLPGKVLAPVLGQPMIARQIERLRRSRRIGRILVATSAEASDDPLAEALAGIGVEVVRGPLNDVLGRFLVALDLIPDAEVVLRLTADCPLADWRTIDDLIGLLPRLFTAKATTGVSGASLLLQEVPAGSWSHLIYVSGEQQAETEQLSSIGRLTALICGERFNEKDYAAQLSELEL